MTPHLSGLRQHGSISTTPSTWADYKDTVTIYVKPDKGYELDTLRVYDSDKDRVSVYTNYHDLRFTMPNSSVTVYATFKDNYDHFIDVSTGIMTPCTTRTTISWTAWAAESSPPTATSAAP